MENITAWTNYKGQQITTIRKENKMGSTYGHISWDNFRKLDEDKLYELGKVFQYSNMPRDWFCRKEIVKASIVKRFFYWFIGGTEDVEIVTHYIRMEELEWDDTKRLKADEFGIVVDGDSKAHNTWLYEFGEIDWEKHESKM